MKILRIFNGYLLVAICFFIVNNTNAQGSYINLNVGYAFCMSSETNWVINNYSSTQNSITEEQIYLSLGKGVNFGGTVGYMFNKHIGAELGLSYLMGGETEGKNTYSMEYQISNTSYSLSSNMFRIIPSLVIAAGTDKVNPYVKFGVVVGIGSIISAYKSEDTNIDVGSGDEMTSVTEQKRKMNGGVAIGINGAVGALFELSDKVSLYGELNAINMSYAPTKSVLTEATYNGVDYLEDMTTREREIEFVDKYTYDYYNPPSASEPGKELKRKFPYGSIGINAGVVFNF